jgi:sensor histidine kinase regulating citrate/malate metabolism
MTQNKRIDFLGAPLYLLLTVCFGVTLFILLWSIYLTSIKRKVAETESVLQQEFKAMVSSVQSDRHDMNNHLTVISGLMQLNSVERANDYIRNLIGEIEINNRALTISDPLLAALIYAKSSVFRRSNIKFELTMDSNLISRMMSPTDTVRVLTNLLDNAFEEVCILSEEFRQIQMRLRTSETQLVIRISNSTQSDSFDKRFLEPAQSTKNNDGRHGYGLSIVNQIVKKYRGELAIEVKNQQFCVEIILPIQGEQ